MKIRSGWERWKLKFCEDKAAGDAGGSGGGAGGEGAAGGAGAADGAGGEGAGGEGAGQGKEGDSAAAGKTAADEAAAKFDTLTKENEALKKFQSSAVQHLEQDAASGEWRPKAAKPAPIMPTQEEIEHAQVINEAAERSAQLMDVSRKAEEKIMNKFKASDPLFAKNIIKARERISTLPLSQRTEVVWERAYNMEAGETAMKGEYASYHEAQGRDKALKELADAGRITLPEGSRPGEGGAGNGKGADISRVKLSREQLGVAHKMVEGGFIKSVDEYKENLVLLGEADVE